MFSCVLWLYKIGYSSRTCILTTQRRWLTLRPHCDIGAWVPFTNRKYDNISIFSPYVDTSFLRSLHFGVLNTELLHAYLLTNLFFPICLEDIVRIVQSYHSICSRYTRHHTPTQGNLVQFFVHIRFLWRHLTSV